MEEEWVGVEITAHRGDVDVHRAPGSLPRAGWHGKVHELGKVIDGAHVNAQIGEVGDPWRCVATLKSGNRVMRDAAMALADSLLR